MPARQYRAVVRCAPRRPPVIVENQSRPGFRTNCGVPTTVSLVSELHRRNVFRVALAYLAASWLIIQVVETIFPLFGLPDSIARAVVVVLAIGLVPALVFSWVFELTPEGFRRESQVERAHSRAAETGRGLDRLIIVVLALAVAYFAFDRFVLSDFRLDAARDAGRAEALVGSYGDRSIAVLPFADMSRVGDQRYLSDGIAEELLNLLARIPNLRVISRSSSFSFRDRNVPITTIAEQLGVAYILEGSVRRAGNRVRITSQLIEARADRHIWSHSFERKLGDIFRIQDEIARAVVSELKVTLLGDDFGVTAADPEAYARFLEARYLHENPSAESFAEALLAYREAVEIDPRYAPAWVWLAALYDDLETAPGLTYAETGKLAKEALANALEIDPDYALAWGMRAIVTQEWDRDLVAAADDMQRALDLDPANPVLKRWASLLIMSLGRFDEAVRINEHLRENDPLGWITRYNLAVSYLHARRFPEAVKLCRTMLAVNPDSSGARYLLARALLYGGDAAAALIEASQQSSPVRRAFITAMAEHAIGRDTESEAALAELRARFAGGEASVADEIAAVHGFAGRKDTAFEWLGRAIAADPSAAVPNSADFARLQEDPRWDALMRRAGRSEAELAAIRLVVPLPERPGKPAATLHEVPMARPAKVRVAH